MKLDKNKLKQKIKDIGVEHGLKISAACGVICGIIGLTAAEYYRREYNKLITVEKDDTWTTIEVHKMAIQDMLDGATMKVRMKKSTGRGEYVQYTTEDEFRDDANQLFNDF